MNTLLGNSLRDFLSPKKADLVAVFVPLYEWPTSRLKANTPPLLEEGT